MINKTIHIIGAANDKGAGIRGARMGPYAIRCAGLIEMLKMQGITYKDCGDILTDSIVIDNMTLDGFKNLREVNAANLNLYKKVLDSLKAGAFPLILGGDHSIALGSVAALQKHYQNAGLIWVDAHGDFNDDKSSPSGNIHGMPLSALTGYGPEQILPFNDSLTTLIKPENAVIIGARSLDSQEKLRLKQAGITVFSSLDIEKEGISTIIEKAVKKAGENTRGFFLSFDLDAIDPVFAPGVSTPVGGGLTYREACLMCRYLSESEKLLGVEIVELNPACDIKNQTGEIAVEMILRLL